MNYEFLDCDIRDSVAHVALLGTDGIPAGEFCDEMVDMLMRLQDDRAVRVVLLTDAGGPWDMAFDVRAIAESWHSGDGPGLSAGNLDTIRRLTTMMNDLPKPIIVAVSGDVRDDGFGLLMNADVRLAAPTATFTAGDMITGMLPDWGLSHLLPRRMGTGRTLEMIWSGRSIPADEAYTIGLIDRLVPGDAWEETVGELVRRIAGLPQPAVQMSKLAVQQSAQFDLTTAMSLEYEAQEKCWDSEETAAALAAHLEGQVPDFSVILSDEDV